MVFYSRKFPSGTFEQVSHLVKEVVSLTEACCAEEADPDCYDNRVGYCGRARSVEAHRRKSKQVFMPYLRETLYSNSTYSNFGGNMKPVTLELRFILA